MDPGQPAESRNPLDSIRQLLSALNCGALVIDRAGKIVHVNSRLASMTRLPREQLEGANVLDMYTEEADRARVRKSLDRFDERAEEEFVLPLPEGKRLPVIASARPLAATAPLSDFRLVTMIDISRQKEAEQNAKEQYQHVLEMSDTLLQQALELKRYSQKLEQRVRERTAELHDAHMDAVYMLAVASEAKDTDTGKHVRRIEQASVVLAKKLGMSASEAEAIGYSSILHDVGKIHIPDEILTKPGPLDDRERARMQLHTLAGERILAASAFFARARKIARAHHENWDGSGYPDGVAGCNIPVEARIVHLVDVYDALTHDRVYKKAWPHEQAMDSIRRGRGTMFDPEIVDAFDGSMKESSSTPLTPTAAN
ncbi:MAG TPA: HD domain-containing phosphohydrolase [Tepidisphaeraceae bacterium]|jgi:PAS domain S-box-containing protein